MAQWNINSFGSPVTSVHVEIVGEIFVEDAYEAAERVSEHLSRVKAGQADVIIDLTQLEGYPVSARDRWAQMLKKHRDGIGRAVWVTPKTTYRMVARAVGLLTGIPTHVVDDLQRAKALDLESRSQ